MRGVKGGTKRGLDRCSVLAADGRDDTSSVGVPQVDAPDLDRLHYMADLIVELQSLAKEMRLEVLKRLLGLAHIEALREAAEAGRQHRAGRPTA